MPPSARWRAGGQGRTLGARCLHLLSSMSESGLECPRSLPRLLARCWCPASVRRALRAACLRACVRGTSPTAHRGAVTCTPGVSRPAKTSKKAPRLAALPPVSHLAQLRCALGRWMATLAGLAQSGHRIVVHEHAGAPANVCGLPPAAGCDTAHSGVDGSPVARAKRVSVMPLAANWCTNVSAKAILALHVTAHPRC